MDVLHLAALDLQHFFHAVTPIDFFIGVISFAVGIAARRNARGTTAMLQMALLLFRLTKYFVNNHPQGKKLPVQHKTDLTDLYKKHLEVHDKGYMATGETEALG